MNHTRRAGLAAAAIVAVACLVPGTAHAAPAGVTIPSGVTAMTGAASDATRGVYWVVQQSGTDVVAVTPGGAVSTTVQLSATPQDVEALSYFDGKLYLGDIGDPGSARSQVAVYEPLSLTGTAKAAYHAWDFSYPDGAHDAAAMMISPKGNLYIVTRGTNPGIYRAPLPWSTSRVNALVRVADAPAGVTDATFVSSSVVAMRTDTSVEVLDAYTWKVTGRSSIPGQTSGEALTTALGDTSSLMAGSGASLAGVAIPTSMSSASPATSSSPAASHSASSSSSAAATVTGSSGSKAKARTGTLAALIAAAVVSLLAAGAVALRR